MISFSFHISKKTIFKYYSPNGKISFVRTDITYNSVIVLMYAGSSAYSKSNRFKVRGYSRLLTVSFSQLYVSSGGLVPPHYGLHTQPHWISPRLIWIQLPTDVFQAFECVSNLRVLAQRLVHVDWIHTLMPRIRPQAAASKFDLDNSVWLFIVSIKFKCVVDLEVSTDVHKSI